MITKSAVKVALWLWQLRDLNVGKGKQRSSKKIHIRPRFQLAQRKQPIRQCQYDHSRSFVITFIPASCFAFCMW